jgi:hypothetical protein
MFDKLKALIFEDDGEEIEEEEEYEPVKPVKKVKPVSQKVVSDETPVQRPSMQRIDVTQQIKTPVVPTYEERKPVVNTQESVFRSQPVERVEPVQVRQTPVVEKPRTVGLTVDDVTSTPRVKTPNVTASTPKATKTRKTTPVYEFNPVISPIFGVDEKDEEAVQNTGKVSTARKTSSSKKDDNVSKIISPIYGMTREELAASQPEVVESPAVEEVKPVKTVSTPVTSTPVQEPKEEDPIPEFSLDDILSVRDSFDDTEVEEKVDEIEEEVEDIDLPHTPDLPEVPVRETKTVKEETKKVADMPALPKKPVFDTASLFDEDDM